MNLVAAAHLAQRIAQDSDNHALHNSFHHHNMGVGGDTMDPTEDDWAVNVQYIDRVGVGHTSIDFIVFDEDKETWAEWEALRDRVLNYITTQRRSQRR